MTLTDNHFEVFGLELSFLIDKQALKTKFYKLSREYHPDFYSLESTEKQDEVMAMSGKINTAYKVLNEDSLRIKYVLEVLDLIGGDEKQELSPDFLMEMMEINEEIMDAKMEANDDKLDAVKQQIDSFEATIDAELSKSIEFYENEVDRETNLKKIKEFYLKSRYLLRIKENLSTFARL